MLLCARAIDRVERAVFEHGDELLNDEDAVGILNREAYEGTLRPLPRTPICASEHLHERSDAARLRDLEPVWGGGCEGE